MRCAEKVTLCVFGVMLGLTGTAAAQVTARAEAFSTRGLLLESTPLLETGDTTLNGVDLGEDFATEVGGTPGVFTDTAPGTILDLAPLAVVNGGDSSIIGTASGNTSTVTSIAGAATADVLPPLIPGTTPPVLSAATRESRVDLSCEGFTAESGVNLLEINGTPIEIPGTEPVEVVPGLVLVEANRTDREILDPDPNDGDGCDIRVTQTALIIDIADTVLGVIEIRLTGASATLENIDCGCAVIGPTTPTPTATVTPTGTPTMTPTNGTGGQGGGGGGQGGGGGGQGGSGGTGGTGGATPTGTPDDELGTFGGGGCSVDPSSNGGAGLPVLVALALLVWRGLASGGLWKRPVE